MEVLACYSLSFFLFPNLPHHDCNIYCFFVCLPERLPSCDVASKRDHLYQVLQLSSSLYVQSAAFFCSNMKFSIYPCLLFPLSEWKDQLEASLVRLQKPVFAEFSDCIHYAKTNFGHLILTAALEILYQKTHHIDWTKPWCCCCN